MVRAPKPKEEKKPAPKRKARAATPKPVRPKGLARGRWLGDFPRLSAAERRLVECCARGEVWKPDGWDGKRPETPNAANTIRAELIRFLALGGDEAHPVHEAGVMVHGAWVTGQLDLHQCATPFRLQIRLSDLEEEPIFAVAHLPELGLSGSRINGLRADHMVVTGGVYLVGAHVSMGEVRLLGARIGGNLSCDGSRFDNPEGNAIIADGMHVEGDVFFRNGFAAQGCIRLPGSQIGGDLSCGGASFRKAGGRAISASGATVKGGAFFRDTKVEGAIDLATARIGTLVDDRNFWNSGGHILDGLHYDRIIGPTDAETRIRWLERQRADQLNGEDWSPQPWEQLTKTLRDMGHPLEATKVAIAKQERMRRAGKVGGPWAMRLHWLYGVLAGYGYRPLKTVQWMLAVFLGCAFFFHIGAGYGYIGPTTPLLNSPEIAAQVNAECGHRFELDKERWINCPAMPPEYTSFQPFLYSLDLILPLVDLQQEADWAPIVEDPPGRTLPFGAFLRWLMWFEILFGWAMSLMLVAVLGKLVNKD